MKSFINNSAFIKVFAFSFCTCATTTAVIFGYIGKQRSIQWEYQQQSLHIRKEALNRLIDHVDELSKITIP